MPTCHLQGWDVALCAKGPVLVELEGDGGDPIMSQTCFDTGLLDTAFGEFARTAEARAKRTALEFKARKWAEVSLQVGQIGHGFRTMTAGRRDAHAERPAI
jgi:hypothetical protein